MDQKTTTKWTFTSYQKFVIALLAFLQFTVVLDFMVLSPLSAILLDELNITTSQFGLVVSAYAFSAGAAGLLTAGFADRFDRKRLLIFFYTGFLVGTFFCGIAPDYRTLLIARVVTGIFGGVMSSVSYAIITDLFALEKRGRVMGFVQMAFAASQVLGIPFGLYLANHFGWHSPFLLIVALASVVLILVIAYLKPINEHLQLQSKNNAFVHLFHTLSNRRYLKGFSVTIFLATGGFMLMPFGSAFSVNNLGITLEELPFVYMVTGLFTIGFGPLAGKVSDSFGKYRVFTAGSILAIIIITIYCSMGLTPMWLVILMNVLLFAGITARMISSQALITAVPDPKDRGAFMGINSSVMQISGGIASAIAGMIVSQSDSGKILHYDTLGYVVSGTVILTIILMYFINKMIFGPQVEEPRLKRAA
ncbi:MFS transporter [Marinoscillum sp. MHG1-6]|uniref:MFS transporter n=1 Tax=Marinoscillum sp. MHG1-6 TaxID=2959627 RepID=UPI002157B353|nr:MFS transporter [Marinoscillum sp. MHG1-6]